MVQLQLSFGLLYPHFESFAERKTAYKEYRDVWLPGRVPHSNVLVFPGVQGGMTNCNRLKTIPQAYDFFVVTNACTIALAHQLWRRDACRWLTLGVLMAVSPLALCRPASSISPSRRIRRVRTRRACTAESSHRRCCARRPVVGERGGRDDHAGGLQDQVLLVQVQAHQNRHHEVGDRKRTSVTHTLRPGTTSV